MQNGYNHQKFSKAVKEFRTKYVDENVEFSANISKDGIIGKVKKGNIDSVYVSPEKDTIKIHNHPSGTIFSLADIENQTFSIGDGIIASGKYGDYYFVKTPKFDGMKLANKIYNNKEDFKILRMYGDWEGWLKRNQERYGYVYKFIPSK